MNVELLAFLFFLFDIMCIDVGAVHDFIFIARNCKKTDETLLYYKIYVTVILVTRVSVSR